MKRTKKMTGVVLTAAMIALVNIFWTQNYKNYSVTA